MKLCACLFERVPRKEGTNILVIVIKNCILLTPSRPENNLSILCMPDI